MKTAVLIFVAVFGLSCVCSATKRMKGILLVGAGPQPVQLYDPDSGSQSLPIKTPYPDGVYCGGLYKMSDGRFLVIENYGTGKTFYMNLCTNKVECGPPLMPGTQYRGASGRLGSSGTIVSCGGISSLPWTPAIVAACQQLVNNSWVEGPYPMPTARGMFAMTTMNDGTLMATGGRDERTNELDEVTFLRSGGWTKGAPLLKTHSFHAMVTRGNKVTVCGGYDKACGCRRSLCEDYDEHSKKWTPGPTMLERRAEFAMTMYENEWFVFAGVNNVTGFSVNNLDSVERFDASQNKFVWAKHNLTAVMRDHCALSVDVDCSAHGAH